MRIGIVGSGAREDWMALWGEAFPEDDAAWIQWYADSYAARDSILGAWEGIRLVGTVHMNRCRLVFGGREIPSCAVAGVATARDFRGRGIAGCLMEETHRILRREGVPLAYLYPFSYPFYERFGWQAGYRAHAWHADAAALPHGEGCFVWADRPEGEDFAHMAALYRAWSAGYGGYRLRDAAAMEKLWQDAASDGCRLGFRSEKDRRTGYILAAEEAGELRVHDWADGDMASLMAGAARAAGTERVQWMAPTDLTAPGAVCTGQDRDMVRILDFAALADGMRCGAEGSFAAGVEDPVLPENGGVYRVTCRQGRISCVPCGGVPDVTGDIRAWTRFWMGYAPAGDAGLAILAEDKANTAALLAAVQPSETMWLREMYV